MSDLQRAVQSIFSDTVEDIKIVPFLCVFKRVRMNRIDFLRGANRLC